MRKDITALEMRPGDGVVKVGTAVQLNLFGIDMRGGIDLIPGNMATWSSSDEAIAEINRQGRMTPRRPGTVRITATHAGQTAQATFTVA
jgi:hypothetical protein